jgi:hypothetical protein
MKEANRVRDVLEASSTAKKSNLYILIALLAGVFLTQLVK